MKDSLKNKFRHRLRLCGLMEILFFAYLILQLCLRTYWAIPTVILLITIVTVTSFLFPCPHCGERLSPARAAKALRDEATVCRSCEKPILSALEPGEDPVNQP